MRFVPLIGRCGETPIDVSAYSMVASGHVNTRQFVYPVSQICMKPRSTPYNKTCLVNDGVFSLVALRCFSNCLQVKFEGEGVDDYGGPYREIFTQVAAELTSAAPPPSAVLGGNVRPSLSASWSEEIECLLPILKATLTSSSAGDIDGAPTFNVIPDIAQERDLRIYTFLGQLMGIALRCRVATPWRLSQVFWKGIVGERLQEADLVHVDLATYTFVQGIHHWITASKRTNDGGLSRVPRLAASAKDDITGTTFVGGYEHLTWTAPVDGKTVELRPRGREMIVETPELSRFAEEVTQMRLHDGDKALFAVRDGLASVIPAAVLPLFAWEELELQACGRPTVDVDLLQANTEYDDDLSSTDAHIMSFWRVLRAFDDRDRSQFLRFVWARSRLPTRANDFHQKFKIHSPTGEGAREDPDKYLPKAHTCFFSINLPRYSSDEIMSKKLTYTMYNCIEMDADFRLADGEVFWWGTDSATRSNTHHSVVSGTDWTEQLD